MLKRIIVFSVFFAVCTLGSNFSPDLISGDDLLVDVLNQDLDANTGKKGRLTMAKEVLKDDVGEKAEEFLAETPTSSNSWDWPASDVDAYQLDAKMVIPSYQPEFDGAADPAQAECPHAESFLAGATVLNGTVSAGTVAAALDLDLLQEGECRTWCPTSTNDWETKCTWDGSLDHHFLYAWNHGCLRNLSNAACPGILVPAKSSHTTLSATTQGFEYVQLAPVLDDNLTILLGDITKFVPFSPVRFTSLTKLPQGYRLHLRGAPAEHVMVTCAHALTGQLHHSNVTIGVHGDADLTLSLGTIWK